MIPIIISDKAVEEIKSTLASKNIPVDYGLRVGVKGGGCAGVSYVLGFDKKNTNDVEYLIEEIPVYIAKKDTVFLIGMEVDFYEGNDARGFIFVNPDEKKNEVDI